MKRLYLLIAALFIFTQTGNIKAQISFGVMGGINFSDLKAFDNSIESQTKIAIGGLLEYNFDDNFSVSAEPMYIQKGGRQPGNEFNPEIKIELAYIDFPILLKYKFDIADFIKPYILAGPSFSYRLSAELKAVVSGIGFSADLKNVSKPYDFGVTMGGGFEIPVNEVSFIFEVKYSLGLIDIHKNGSFSASGGGTTIEDNFTDDNWFKTKGIQLYVGMKFSL